MKKNNIIERNHKVMNVEGERVNAIIKSLLNIPILKHHHENERDTLARRKLFLTSLENNLLAKQLGTRKDPSRWR
jgi:hypothetical protein